MDQNSSVIAAWWGAIIASIVFLWDIFKWATQGPQIVVNAKPNMHRVNQIQGKLEEENLIFVEAINRGSLPSTITHLAIYQYESKLKKILNKPKTQGVVLQQDTGIQLPYLLGPGAQWSGMINQDDLTEKWGTEGLIYCGVIHSARKKPVLTKVDLSENVT